METEPTQELDAEGLLAAVRGDGGATSEHAIGLLYRELRAQAGRLIGRESPGHTLQATALVNEAWMRLAGSDLDGVLGEDAQQHFIALATTAMRRILVDHARAKGADRRGGDWERITISGEELQGAVSAASVVEINDALDALAVDRPRMARMAELRLFGGLSTLEAGAVLDLGPTTSKDEWKLARAFLTRALRDSSN